MPVLNRLVSVDVLKINKPFLHRLSLKYYIIYQVKKN